VQQWFFEQAEHLPAPQHWNQALLLEVGQALDRSLMEAAVRHLLAHHDALRLRFQRGPEDKAWSARLAGLDDEIPLTWFSLAGLASGDLPAEIESQAAALQASLDLTRGPLFRVAYFDLGPTKPDRLLIIAHHLVIDGVSWRILLEDLQTAYAQLSHGEACLLPPKTTSFRYWAQKLAEYSQSEMVRAEESYWLSLSGDGFTRLPLDYPAGEAGNKEASARSFSAGMTVGETRALLQEVPAAYHVQINDVLLAALAETFRQWTGSSELLVDLEGHGREDLFPDVDVSRTVGWFTAIFPVRLDLQGAETPGMALQAVSAQLQALPQRGVGYGLLRYLRPDPQPGARLRDLPHAEVSFNYLGNVDRVFTEAGPLRPAAESAGPVRDLDGTRTHIIDINGGIVADQLQFEWTYSAELHRPDTIERLAQSYIEALRSLIAAGEPPTPDSILPSAFADFGWNHEDVQEILRELEKPDSRN
jgi:non-ribosomal peptide synthase protein (TIGR01720 family)